MFWIRRMGGFRGDWRKVSMPIWIPRKYNCSSTLRQSSLDRCDHIDSHMYVKCWSTGMKWERVISEYDTVMMSTELCCLLRWFIFNKLCCGKPAQPNVILSTPWSVSTYTLDTFSLPELSTNSQTRLGGSHQFHRFNPSSDRKWILEPTWRRCAHCVA